VTTIAWIFLGVATVYAFADWFAVATGDRFLEYIAKPSVMVFLIGVALTVDASSDAAQVWFAVALACSLAGDVFLMVPGDRFVPGLVSFLLAHLAYVVGLLQMDLSAPFLVVGLVFGAVVVGVVGTRILGAVRSSGHDELVIPVGVYIGAIATMAVAAFATGDGRAIVGAILFVSSDAMLGWDRFAGDPASADPVTVGGSDGSRLPPGELGQLPPAAPAPFGLPGNTRMWIHITYQVGQALLVLSLI
jgi:uncharacterized membrane protein YhhN